MRLRTLLGAVALGGLSLLPALLGSCGKTPEPPVPLSRWETPYFFTEILEPQTIQLRQGQTYPELLGATKTSIEVLVSGNIYNWFRVKQRDKFLQLARKIGDAPAPQAHVYATPNQTQTLSAGISSVSMVAVTVYNDRYRAGADLTPIVRVCYDSYDHRFDGRIVPMFDTRQGYGRYVREPGDPLLGAKYPSIYMGHYGQDTQYSDVRLLALGLTEEPTVSPQTFRLTLRLTDGQVFTADLTADLMKD